MAVTLYLVKWPLDESKDRLLTTDELLAFAHHKTVGGFPENVHAAIERIRFEGYEVRIKNGSGLQ